MRTLWMSFLRPVVDYCSPLWSPRPTSYSQIKRLERILRSSSKNAEGISDLPYSKRLKAMNLHSIQRRHERYKILYVYKIKEGLVPNLPNNPTNPELSFALQFINSPRHGTRCDIPNLIPHHNPAAIPRKSSFAQTASNLWNCLPPCISSISGKSVTQFKSQLDKFLDLFPDEPRCSSPVEYYDENTGRLSNSIRHLKSLETIKSSIVNFDRRMDYVDSLQGRASPR